MTSSGVISDASATVAECFAGTGDDADATQFFNPMWAGAIDQEDSTLRCEPSIRAFTELY